jgi:PAS domain S-box-containing protein
MSSPKPKKQPELLSNPLIPFLSRAQERAETDVLLASIGEGVIASDSNGKITRINQAALDILHYKEDELLGDWFPAAVVATYEDGTAIDMMDRPVTKAVMSGQTVTTRTIYRRKDSSLVPVSLTVSPVIYHGKPIGAIEVFRDITHDIQSDKMKTEFISVASHQLRTPLSAINIYSRMLGDGMAGELNSEQTSFIKSILASVDRMNHLINTLLNITRIEAGGVNVKLSTVELHDLAHEILDEVMPAAASKRLRLVDYISTRTPAIDTDALLVREVYANLLSNAVKYTPEGGTITIRLASKKNALIFSVRDTGFGIPQAAQQHIFTKFFRADNILSQDVSGTGLGLYFTKTIAESLNGEIWFDSTEGVGSTFYFSLPRQGSIARTGKFKMES